MKITGHQAGCSATGLAYLVCAEMGVRLMSNSISEKCKSFVYVAH